MNTATEHLERMEALVRRMAEDHKPGVHYVTQMEPLREEARALVAEMEPVDTDLIEARNIVMQVHKDRGFTNLDRTELDRGDFDHQQPMIIALAALRRGRELARGEG